MLFFDPLRRRKRFSPFSASYLFLISLIRFFFLLHRLHDGNILIKDGKKRNVCYKTKLLNSTSKTTFGSMFTVKTNVNKFLVSSSDKIPLIKSVVRNSSPKVSQSSLRKVEHGTHFPCEKFIMFAIIMHIRRRVSVRESLARHFHHISWELSTFIHHYDAHKKDIIIYILKQPWEECSKVGLSARHRITTS